MTVTDVGREFLEHFGTKGMKWGVRREAKRSGRADKKWEKKIFTVKGAVAVHNAAADVFNERIGAVNSRHPKADMVLHPESQATKKYIRDAEALSAASFSAAVKQVHGSSPSGKLTATMDTSNPEQYKIVISPTNIEHAIDTLPEFIFEIDLFNVGSDQRGRISSMRKAKDNLGQTALVGLEFLEHFGTKGMKWGVRKHRNEGKRAKTFSGGKKSVKDIPDQELRDILNRMQMEQQYKNLSKPKKNAGAEFAKSIVLNVARTQATNVINAQIAKSLSGRKSL